MSIIGHAKCVEFLETVPVVNIPQTLLFVGPRSVGKTTLVHAVCARLLGCTAEAAATHPRALHITAGEDPKTGTPRAAISVSAIRDLRPLFSVQQSGPLLIIIERAEELHAESSNALLKIMEEPGRQLFFMILARSEESVLQTIRSRAARFTLSPVSRADLYSGLAARGFDEKNIAEASDFAEGCPGKALRFLTDSEFHARVVSERARFSRVRGARMLAHAEPLLADLFAKKDRHIEARAELAEMLEWWLQWLRQECPDHPALQTIAKTIPLLFENMHPRLLLERVVIELVA